MRRERGARALCLCSKFKDDGALPSGPALPKTQERHGSHLTAAACYRETTSEELSPLFGWSSEKKPPKTRDSISFSPVLTHELCEEIRRDALRFKGAGRSGECSGRCERGTDVSAVFLCVASTSPREPLDLASEHICLRGPVRRRGDTKCVDISIGGRTQVTAPLDTKSVEPQQRNVMCNTDRGRIETLGLGGGWETRRKHQFMRRSTAAQS